MIEESQDIIEVEENFLLVLDSRNATTNNSPVSYNSDLTFNLQEPITLPLGAINLKASVLNFACPNSQYIINNLNNVLGLHITGDGTYTDYYIQIPNGNYNVISFQTALLDRLTYVMNKYSVTGVFTMSYNSTTYQYTLAHSKFAFYINQNLIFNNFDPLFPSTAFYTIGDVMGFDNTKIYNSVANSITFPYPTNFGGLNNLNIHFDNIKTNNIPYQVINKNLAVLVNGLSKEYQDFSKKTIAISIPVNCNPNEVIYYQKNASFEILIKDEIIDYLRISLRDDLGNLLQLNNNNFNLTIKFTINKIIQRKTKSFFSILNNPYPKYE